MTDERPSLADVAAKLAKGDPPPWLIVGLKRLSVIVGLANLEPDEETDRRMLEAAKYLEEWLVMYVDLEKLEPEFECPEAVHDCLGALYEVIELLEEDAKVPKRAGGPRPDKRLGLCAAVVSEAYRMLHGVDRVQPYSPAVQEACEAYWQACGNEPTGRQLEGEPRNWERHLKDHRRDDDGWVRSILQSYRDGTHT